MNSRAAEEEFRAYISLISAPPMNEDVALLFFVGPPVRTTARREGCEDRDLHVCISRSSSALVTMLSLDGLEIVIVAVVVVGSWCCNSWETPGSVLCAVL